MGVVFSARPGRFRVGDAVTVRTDAVDHHHRTPAFIKGNRGSVRSGSVPFLVPESRAHCGTGEPRRLLYHVEFRQAEVWAERCREGWGDLLLMDLYEQWLEAAAGPPWITDSREEAI